MDNARFEVHTEKLENLFVELGKRKQRRVMKQALRKATRILVRETKKNLKSAMGKAATKKSRYGKSMMQGIKQSIARDGASAKVHIMGEYKLKWFEKGTAERYLRKSKAYRGRITAKYFFKKANQSKQKEMQDSVNDFLLQSIFKAAKNSR